MMRLAFPALALPLLTTVAFAEGGFYGDPPDATHPWAIHDMNRPQPARVEPGSFSTQAQPGTPPSDAVILFGGKPEEIEKWQAKKTPAEPTQWVVKDSVLQCVPGSGYVRTKEEFGDCQLHIEWSAPTPPEGKSQGRGNSGVFLMGQVEVQVLDNYDNPTYADGFASSIYGINPPLANALRAPGEWQTYDIIFRRPIFDGDEELDPGYITVFVNGVLTQDHTPLEGGGGHRARSKPRAFPEKGPLELQDHGNPVRYRNIWYRPLPKRAIEGGDTSHMSEAATTAKRKEIAAKLREEAAQQEGDAKMYHLMESLCYEQDKSALEQVNAMTAAFITDLKATPKNKLEARKADALKFKTAADYLVKFKLLPDDFTPKAEITEIVKANEWDKKK